MVIPLAALLIAVLALGFMAMEAMLERLTQETDQAGVLGVLLSPVTKVLHVLNRAQRTVWKELVSIMSRFAGASIHALAHWFWSLERLAADTAHGIAALAETVADAFEHAFTTTIPHMIRDAVRTETRLRRIADEQLRRYARGIDRLVRDHVIPRVRAVERAVTVTIPHQFERAWARDKAIAGRIPHGLRSRLKHVERALAPAAIFGVVLTRLFRRWPWLACRRLTARKTGLFSRLCGLDPTMMESLLSSALLVLSLVELRAMARGLQEPTSLTLKGMEKFIRELDDLR